MTKSLYKKAQEATIYVNGSEGSKQKITLPNLRVGIFFDGTGNNVMDHPSFMSNVGKLWYAYEDNDVSVRKIYARGVGTKRKCPSDDNLDNDGASHGSIAGAYGHNRISYVCTLLQEIIYEYKAVQGKFPQRIFLDVFGFSRGAALARHFTYLVANTQISTSGYYDKIKDRIKVNFLGIFDSVGSFGWPGDNEDDGYNFRIDPQSVKYCYHLVSHDEIRKNFDLQTLKKDITDSPVIHAANKRKTIAEATLAPEGKLPSAFIVEEVGEGVHSDIGGSYQDEKTRQKYYKVPTEQGAMNNDLGRYNLQKMYKMALQCGLPLANEDRLQNISVLHYTKIHKEESEQTCKPLTEDLYSLWNPIHIEWNQQDTGFWNVIHDVEQYKPQGKLGQELHSLWKLLHIQLMLANAGLESLEKSVRSAEATGVYSPESGRALEGLKNQVRNKKNEISEHKNDRIQPLKKTIIHSYKADGSSTFEQYEKSITKILKYYFHKSHYPFSGGVKGYLGMQPEEHDDPKNHPWVKACVLDNPDFQGDKTKFVSAKVLFVGRNFFKHGSQDHRKAWVAKPQEHLLVYAKFLVGSKNPIALAKGHMVHLMDEDNFQVDDQVGRCMVKEDGIVEFFLWDFAFNGADDDFYFKVLGEKVYGQNRVGRWESRGKKCILQQDKSLAEGYWENYTKGRLGSKKNPIHIVIDF